MQLIDILNSLLEGVEKPITELSYLPSEYKGAGEYSRSAILDLHCKTQRSTFIVELQNVKQEFFVDRTIFYSTFPIQSQGIKGNWNFELDNVYSIALLNFKLPPNQMTPHSIVTTAKLVNIETGKIFYEKLVYIYVELPKFRKNLSEISGHKEKWFYLMTNMATMKEVPNVFKEKVFMEFLEKAEIAQLDENEQFAYHQSLKRHRDQKNTKDYARKEGREKGIKVGQEMIELERKQTVKRFLKIAKRLRDNGYDQETIMEIIGLSKENMEQAF
jgi:predicted transposase/invertase (TIGR01784 family)